MGLSKNKEYQEGFRGILFLLIGGLLFVLSACATAWPTPGTTSPADSEKPPRGEVFRSDDYIVYVTEGGETPETLAKSFLGDARKSWIIEDANEGVSFRKGKAVVIPLKEENKGGLTARGYQAVPVLTYHHFGKDCTSPYCMPTAVFDRQMRYLKKKGYRVITLSELLNFVQYRHAIPKKSVVIAIDDGNKSAYEIAYPILRKYGYTATLFIYTDFVGVSEGAITWEQLREMKATGFEMGSHTKSHSDLTKQREGESDHTYAARVKSELLGSKRLLDKNLRQDTLYLAFPYGRYNETVLAISQQVGYKLGFSVRRGGNPFFSDPLRLKRDQILKREMETFARRLKTFYDFPLK
ncbi:MAG: polysaccharide deacetylase family protein [Deltaproteobacteria bacterium]|nr:MAG: polysaccharide deacetylase family protein [Deltaproteobacteria bacterium]